MNISLNMDPAPVQLDAIMGYVNAVQEMLLYAAPGYIALLPALEERLYQGSLKNFRYSDGKIAMEWDVDTSFSLTILRIASSDVMSRRLVFTPSISTTSVYM